MTDIEQTECELLPCPWCDADPRGVEFANGYYHMGCYCGARGPDYARAEGAIAAWNRRAPSMDAERLDWMKPGFRYLASDHVEQVMWPDENGKVTNQVNVSKGSGVRAAIDAAINATNQEDQ